MIKKDTWFNFKCEDIANELLKPDPERWIYQEIESEVGEGSLTLKEHTKEREKWLIPRYFMSPKDAIRVFDYLSEKRTEYLGLKFIAGYYEEFVLNHRVFLEYFGSDTYKGLSMPYYNKVQELREPLFQIIEYVHESEFVKREIFEKGLDLFANIIKEGEKSIEKWKKKHQKQIDELTKIVEKCERSQNTIAENLQTISHYKQRNK